VTAPTTRSTPSTASTASAGPSPVAVALPSAVGVAAPPHRRVSRLGRRFVVATLAVLAMALLMIAVAAQAMFINEHDLGLLMWVLVPAVLAAALVAMLIARPLARDARLLCDAAMQVAEGDLSARTGVTRNDELGEAAAMFDRMVERLDSIERERTMMLSSISHDLRTPLSALRVSVEAIRDGVATDPDRYLTGMEQQVRALAALVDDLQLHTRLVSGTLELQAGPVDLSELADESIEAMRPLAESGEVRLELAVGERVMVTADAAQLGRVIRNLLENAIRYSPPRSVVRVTVDRADDRAVIRVSDEGDGFPADFRDRAFEAFTRADPARDKRTGTAGLGLAIARGIVTAHGGVIRIGSGPGGVVEVRLP